MTEIYRRHALRKHIHHSIQAGGSFVGNRYYYNALDNQVGGGIGGIFKSLFKFAAPLLKSGAKTLAIKGKDILQPQLKKLAKSAGEAGERWVNQKVSDAGDKAVKKLESISRKRKAVKRLNPSRKRKRDALDESI